MTLTPPSEMSQREGLRTESQVRSMSIAKDYQILFFGAHFNIKGLYKYTLTAGNQTVVYV